MGDSPEPFLGMEVTQFSPEFWEGGAPVPLYGANVKDSGFRDFGRPEFKSYPSTYSLNFGFLFCKNGVIMVPVSYDDVTRTKNRGII
jgi:hypothetical protein